MGRRRRHEPLSVLLNGRLVGRLEKDSSGAIAFQYDPAWLEWAHALPVSLSLPLREDRYIGAPVVAVFDNLLPDNDQIRRRLAERSGADGVDAYNLLAAVGRDCVGALQFMPETKAPAPAGHVDGRKLGEEDISRLIADLAQTPLGVSRDSDFRISIAGAQDKTALLYWQDGWYLPRGASPTTHILKPQIGLLPSGIDLSQSPENEHFCMKLAAALGLPCAATKVRDFGDQRVLVIERFDRHWTRDGRLLRLPHEDCCQALGVPPTRKYEPDGGPGVADILSLLKASDQPVEDRRMFLKAQIFFWLIGATDGHAKNFSLFLAPGGRFHLAPLYDVMSAQPNADAGQIRRNQMKLAMAVGDNRHYVIDRIAPRHFRQTAARCGVAPAVVDDIFEELAASAEAAIDAAQSDLPPEFPAAIAGSINAAMMRRLGLFKDDAGA